MGSAIDVALQLLNLFVAGTTSFEKFQALQQQLSAIKAEGRDPTADEWNTLISDVETQGGQLEEADKKLNP